MIDTGIRRGELAAMTVDDVDLVHEEVTVVRKGGWRQSLSILPKTARDLDHYLRIRTSHPYAVMEDLWLGTKGPISGTTASVNLARFAGHGEGHRVLN